MRAIFLTITMFVASLTMSTNVLAGEGTVLTWQNSAGFWFACGPVQCIQAGEKTEQKAMSYVLNENYHYASFVGGYYRCNRYSVSGLKSYDNSSEKVQRLAKCN